MRHNKAVTTFFATFVVAMLSGCTIFNSHKSSTHHASIRAEIAPSHMHGDSYTEQRKERIEQLIPLLTSDLNSEGLTDVTDLNVKLSTTSFGNGKNDRILKFKSESIEALIVFDSDEYEKVSICLSEGYSSEPSKELINLYSKLDQSVDQIECNKYESKIW